MKTWIRLHSEATIIIGVLAGLLLLLAGIRGAFILTDNPKRDTAMNAWCPPYKSTLATLVNDAGYSPAAVAAGLKVDQPALDGGVQALSDAGLSNDAGWAALYAKQVKSIQESLDPDVLAGATDGMATISSQLLPNLPACHAWDYTSH